MTLALVIRTCTAGGLFVAAYGLGAVGGAGWMVAVLTCALLVLITWGSSPTR